MVLTLGVPYDDDKRAAVVMEYNSKASFGTSGRGTVHEKGVMMMRSKQLLATSDERLPTTDTRRVMSGDADDCAAAEHGGSHMTRAEAAAADRRERAA